MDGLFPTHAWTADMKTDAPEQQTAEPTPSANKLCVTEHSIYLLYPFRVDKRRLTPGKGFREANGQLTRPTGRLSAVIAADWQPEMTAALRAKAETLKGSFGKAEKPSADQPAAAESEKPSSGGRPENPPPDGVTGDDNVWQKSIWKVARDMEPHAARLLSQWPAGDDRTDRDKGAEVDGGRQSKRSPERPSEDPSDEEGDADCEKVGVWSLKPDKVRNALRGRVGLASFLAPRLAIKFSPAARKRLEARLGTEVPNSVTIEIEEVRALTFPTGQGLLIAEIKVRADGRARTIAPSLLVEAVVAVGNERHLTWLARDGETLQVRGVEKKLKLRDVFSTLLGDYAENGITGARTYAYTYARLDQVMDAAERQQLMIRLACKYTDDYRIDPAAFDERIYQPFESVSHLAALEGAATLVEHVASENRAAPNFLKDYKTNAIERRYLPVVVLAYHAFLTLLRLTQDSRRPVSLSAPSKGEVKYMTRLRDGALRYRLFYRLSYVSLLTMPNEFYRRLGHAFGLERMLASADRDVAEISALLDSRRSRWFRLLTAGSLAIISGATLGRILLELKTVSWLSGPLAWIRSEAPWMQGNGPVVELVLAIVFGALALWWSEGGKVDEEVDNELSAHTGLDWREPGG